MIESPRIVLVIEDVPNIVTIIRRSLNGTLTRVLSAEDGESGLDLVRDTWPDLVLLDLGLPGISGWDVLETLRAEGFTMPIVIVTADDAPETARRAAESGAVDLLTKPFDPAELRTVVVRHGFPEIASVF